MKKDELFHAGKIVRTFGSKGEVICLFNLDILPFIKKLELVFILINDNPIPFFIDTIQTKSSKQFTIKFLDIESIDDCKDILDCEIHLPQTLLPKKSGKNFYTHEIIGYSVVDEKMGIVGTLENIIEFPHQSLLSIENAGKEIFIPLVDEFVKSIDKKKKTICIDAPEGLIDLNI